MNLPMFKQETLEQMKSRIKQSLEHDRYYQVMSNVLIGERSDNGWLIKLGWALLACYLVGVVYLFWRG